MRLHRLFRVRCHLPGGCARNAAVEASVTEKYAAATAAVPGSSRSAAVDPDISFLDITEC
jgi:hypothetical protein